MGSALRPRDGYSPVSLGAFDSFNLGGGWAASDAAPGGAVVVWNARGAEVLEALRALSSFGGSDPEVANRIIAN